MSEPRGDITIAGAGLRGTWHLTREAEAAVRAARLVLFSLYNAGIAEHVRALNPTAEVRSSEEDEYGIGMYRPAMYARMARVVLDAASAGPGVVVLCPGSTMVVDMVSQLVLEGARDAGLGVRVLPGISVLAEVERDVSAGLQVVLAQKLVLNRIELDPTIAAIVLQPAYFDTLFHAGARRSRRPSSEAPRACSRYGSSGSAACIVGSRRATRSSSRRSAQQRSTTHSQRASPRGRSARPASRSTTGACTRSRPDADRGRAGGPHARDAGGLHDARRSMAVAPPLRGERAGWPAAL